MINKFKAIDNIGLISYLRKLVLAIRLFFATKSEMDVVATALTDLDNRKIEASDIPASLPANGGNADTLDELHSSAFKKTWIAHAGGEYVGWVTIAKWTINTPSYFSPYPFMLSIYREYSSPSTETYTFSITFGWDTANIVQVNGNAGTRIIEKLRIAKCSDNLTYRLEMYVNTDFTTYSNLCRCVAYGNYGNDFSFNTVYELSSDVTSTLAEITTAPNYIVGNLSGNAATASIVDWSGVTNTPTSFTPSSHTHTTSEITNFPTIGNGALHIKVNGTELTPEGGIFTANKGGDSTIDLSNSLATRPELNTLGGRMDKIDTSIAELNAKTQVTISSDDSSNGEEEEIAEAIDNPFSEQMGTITLRFWNMERYENLPVYDVWVNYVTDVVGPFGYVNYCYEIFLVIDIYDYLNSIVSSVGFTSGIYKPFFIRGANSNNHVCGFDIRGNGNINTALATIIGRYMHLKCHLQLHRGDNIEGDNIGEDIMVKAKNKQFNAYLCLRQTI